MEFQIRKAACGTYFVVESEGRIAGCGGWSRRQTLYGSKRLCRFTQSGNARLSGRCGEDTGVFHPSRMGEKRHRNVDPGLLRIGSGLRRLFFGRNDVNLPGVPLYSARGYAGDEPVKISVGDGVAIECFRMRKELG